MVYRISISYIKSASNWCMSEMNIIDNASLSTHQFSSLIYLIEQFS